MREVRGPNGIVVRFPDGTDDATVDRVMRERTGASPAAAPSTRKPVYSGAILPVTQYDDGTAGFDSNAGLLGMAKRALSLPGDVYQGKVDPRSDEAVERSFELATLASPINPAMRSEGTVIPGVAQNLQKRPVTPPTSKELIAAGTKGFEDLRGLGVDYKPSAVANRMSIARAELENAGFDAEEAKSTFGVLSQLESPGDATYAPLSGLIRARTRLGNIAQDNKGTTEGAAANALKGYIEKLIKDADPATVMAGPAPAAGKLLDEANANYAAGKRSGRLNRSLDAAELQASSSYSGQNLENVIRRKAARIVDPEHPERASGFSKGELELIRGVAEGKIKGTNSLRFVGNLLGGGGGLGMLATSLGPAAAVSQVLGPVATLATGVVAPGAGYLLKKAATGKTRKAFVQADEAVRMRSPLYERMLAEAPMDAPAQVKRAAMNRALLLMHEQEKQKRKRRT